MPCFYCIAIHSLNFYSTKGKRGLPAKTFDKVDLIRNT